MCCYTTIATDTIPNMWYIYVYTARGHPCKDPKTSKETAADRDGRLYARKIVI